MEIRKVVKKSCAESLGRCNYQTFGDAIIGCSYSGRCIFQRPYTPKGNETVTFIEEQSDETNQKPTSHD